MLVRRFKSDKSGAVTTETAFVLSLMIVVTGGLIEAGNAFFQWNSVQQAARHGARLAATSNPVASDLTSMTGISTGVAAGDPMPSYERTCSGESNSCNSGSFDQSALKNIFYGPDGDLSCGKTSRERRGMCDFNDGLSLSNVEISYTGSGLGRAGYPPELKPLVTVKVTGIPFDFVLLDVFMPNAVTTMPDIYASTMGEDLKSGS